MNNFLRNLILCLSISCSFLSANMLVGQINIDSTYEKSELDRMLEEAQSINDRESLAAVYFLLAEYESKNFYRIGNSLDNYSKAKESLVMPAFKVFQTYCTL